MFGKEKIVTTTYQMQIEAMEPCKIALVSDLHDHPGDRAASILAQEQPDLILAAGDIVERCTYGESEYTKDIMNKYQGIVNDGSLRYKLSRTLLRAGEVLHKKNSVLCGGLPFLEKIAAIAPLYYGLGNHEWYFYPEDRAFFAAHNITLLDNADVYTDGVRIGGLSTRYDLDWLKAFAKKQGPKLLICHHPEYYFRHIKGTEWDTFDLIVSGHVHGGQWRIAGQGVLAPGQGFFPRYTYGVHEHKLVIGTGLSNTASVPRWGNPMEVVMIEINHTKTNY
ncbi:MAG: metallophosphoesterase [Eubacterium sp.]|nr:metallophosphoesterase [Eubacterium sp.]